MNPVCAVVSGSLGQYLDDVALTFPSECALIEVARDRESHRWSYAEVRRRAGWVAAALLEAGLQPGDRVAMVMTNQSRWLVAATAVFRVGGVLVPLDYKLTPGEVDRLLGHAKPAWVVGEYGLCKRLAYRGPALLTDVPKKAILPENWARFDALPHVLVPPVVPRLCSDPAAVVYSSGTGGAPKGCVLSHGAYLHQLDALVGLYPMKVGQRFFSILPTNHAIDFMCGFLAPAACGATVVHQRTLRPEYLRSTLKRYEITHMAAVPMILESFKAAMDDKLNALPSWQRTAIDALIEANHRLTETQPRPAWSQKLLAPVLAGLGGRLELVFTGGAFVRPELAEYFYRLGIGVAIGYGLTEAATVITVNNLHPFRADSVGKAIPGTQVRIHRPNSDGVGEVQVRGPTLMTEYDGAPALTAAAFTSDGWLRTGDLGWLDAAAHLHLVGRSKNMIVTRGGKNIYPEDVEAAIGDAGVEELAVYALDYLFPDGAKLGEECLVAVVRAPNLPSLRAANHRLPEHKRLAGILPWPDDFPRTASMKLKRELLAASVRQTLTRDAVHTL